MTATAVGTRVKGLTIHQVSCVSAEACRVADEVGAPIFSVTANAHIDSTGMVQLHPHDRAKSSLLVAALGLTNICVHDTFIVTSGDWGGVEVKVFGDLPTEAV